MANSVVSVFKLKRGTAARWAELNPILEQGEPGFVYDNNLLKIGDGIRRWNDLPYIEGKTEVSNFHSSDDFPRFGDPQVIYKAANEKSLYQFNSNTNSYEKLSDGKQIEDINHINGGNA